MDQLNSDLRQCVDLLDSSKVTERRKKCSELQDFLQRQDVINLLNNNTKNKEGITWDAVLLTGHRGLLKEADKIRDEEQKGGKGVARLDNPKASFSGLISTITSKANAGGVQRLSAGQLLQCVLSILQERFFCKHFGYTYLQVLRHQILTCHNYCANVGEDNWKDLLQLCEQLYRNPPPRVDKILILSILHLIVKKGGNHSYVALEIKKKFPFILECIKADARTLNLQEHLARLALSICQTLQYECRVAICKFGEEVMSDLKNMYDHRETGASRKKDVLLEWFVLQVRAHHPQGARRGSPGAYAGAWDVWARQLRWLYQLVTAEVTSLLRHRSACRTLRPAFITLAVCVCKQVFEADGRQMMLDMSLISNLEDTSMIEGHNSGSAPKRIRLETGVAAVVDKLSATPQQDMWPWLSLLTALCSQHPELVSEADLLSLLQLCAEQLQTCKDVTTTENLYRCCNTLLHVESQKDTKLLDTVRLKELWESVWDTALRAVGLNLCEEWSHCLVRQLVFSCKPLAVDRLLQLFVSGAIHRSAHSLRTLLAVATNHCISELLGVKQCKALMDWILPSREEASMDDGSSQLACTDLLAKALVALTVKARAPTGEADSKHPAPVTGVEQHYLFTAFEGGLVTEEDGSKAVKDRGKEELLTETELVSHMMMVVTREHFATREGGRQLATPPGTSGGVHTLAIHTQLLAHITSVLREWRLSVDNSLETLLAESCDLTAEAMKDILMSRSDIPTITAVLGRLADLLQLIADTQSAGLVRRLATDYITKACNKLAVVSQRAHQPSSEFDFDEMDTTPANHSEESSPFSEESVQGWAQVQLTAYRSVLQASRTNDDAMIRLLRLPVAGNGEISPTTALHMSLSAAKVVCSLPSVDDAVLYALLVLLQHLCRQWHSNDIATITILGIFQDVCDHLDRCPDDDNCSNYIVLVSGILKFIRKKKYGADVCNRFVCLLGHIAQVDRCGRWSSRMTDDGTTRPLAHELLSFLTSPFHQVRMTACKKIWALFSASSLQQQQMVFDDLLAVVNEIFIIQGDIVAEEQLDEGVLRTASALHTLAAVLAVTSRWRARAMLHTCLLTEEKNLNSELVKKMLTVVASHLGVNSICDLVQPMLLSVLWVWHERFNSLDRFPWPVLGYTSENRFYQANLTAVVPVLVHRRDSNTLKHIASVTGQHIAHIVQACYPVLLGSILPRFADENQQQTASVIIGIVEKYLGDEKVNTMLVSRMGDVITNMLGTLHDPDSLRLLCGGQPPVLPESSKLTFSTDLILGGIHYIQENSPKSDIPLLVYLSQEKPRLIQKCLLKLYSKVHQTKIPEYKLLYLHQFISMCDLVVSVISQPQFKMSHYTVSWLVRVLLHLVHGDTALLSVSYLYKFLTAVLPSHSALVDEPLSVVTSKLVPLASQDTVIGQKVLSVLELLLVTNAESLPSVATLDPLPSEPMFAAMSQQYLTLRYADPLSTSLQAEIQHVLNTGTRDGACRPDGLRHLRKQLSEKKPELEQLYSELRATRGFSEDCEQSILHQLICLLIRITAGCDPEARYEATCCLGELGPADLTTLGLKPDTPSSSAQPLELFLQMVLDRLTKYLFDSNVEVVQATSDALYALFGNFSQQLNGILTSAQTELLYPFLTTARGQKKAQPSSSLSVDEDALATVVPLFCPEDIYSHRRWISRLVNAILNTAQFGFLVPVVDHKEEFANDLFPASVGFVLDISNRTSTTQLFVDQINEFFARQITHTSSDEIYGNRNSVFAMLRVVDSVKKHIHEERQINYLHVSKAALFCSAYFTSVMYAELWASEFNSNREDLHIEGVSQLEFIEEKDSENGQLLQNLLREAYMKIGEPDAVYGCGNTHLLDPRSQIQHYQYEGQWLRVVEACDLQMALQPTQQLSGFESALHLSGLHHLAGRVSSQQSYEAAWRLGRWDLPQPGPGDQSHEGAVYAGLRGLQDCDTTRTLSVVRQARSFVMESLAHTSLEAATNIYTPLAKLRALQEIEDFATLDFVQVTEKWECQDKIGWSNFTDVEAILAQRMALLKIAKGLDQERLVKTVTKFCETAKKEGFHAVAHSWLMSLPGLSQLPSHLLWVTQLLQAQIYWDKQETETARHLLRRLLGQLKDSEQTTLYSRTLHTYGSLVAHTRTEQAQQILEKYLIPAVDNSDNDFKLSAALSLARYADAEYQTLLNYIKSAAYTSKMTSITESLTSAQKLTKAAVASSKAEVDRQTKIDLQKTINMHDRQSKIDQMEVENAQRELDNFLILAIRHYLLSLELGDRQDLCVFRVVSLWLNNYDHEELGEEMAERITRVPSHKLLPVLPQLAARISDNPDQPSTSILHTLIERCARDHPHHVLPLIMALANTYKDADYSQSTINTGAKPEGRVVGAQKMLDKLKQKEPLKTLVRDMQKVAEAYISFAYLPHTAGGSTKVHKIPKTEPITKLKPMGHVLCPTVTLPISRSANYKDIVGIQGFGETYYSVGGINVPKKITCICTDGTKRPQLVKGNDDLRQDAVMQQVFTIMNSLLGENKETQRRRLLIRTYKVVPLSQRSGVIEWCVNTMPLSTYLVGGGGVVGAHTKYRKNLDWLPSLCRQKVSDAAKSSNASKLKLFKEICANFKPVFRHFFFEKFPNPGIWFERKLAYTHSVATSSMVGYILGLGDRHILNILIDERTAEVIHIDFGIAFEQGRTLVTPETVPFRLTRDIIDGMGVSGIEGVFRRSCEKTMEVMRECESTIVTILEVLLYDPLYMWTITPAMAMAKQQGGKKPSQSQPSQGAQEQGQVNKLAERALLRLKQKLQGIEEGSTTSVEGQVSKLIQEATNPANLCRLFHGWQAHV